MKNVLTDILKKWKLLKIKYENNSNQFELVPFENKLTFSSWIDFSKLNDEKSAYNFELFK